MNATARNTGAGHWQYGSQARPYHYPQVRDAIEGNPRGVVSSSPGLRACELPWDIVQTASQPQRGCGRARHPRTQPRWGWSVLTRSTQGSWVARSSQPWALGRNPFGIKRESKSVPLVHAPKNQAQPLLRHQLYPFSSYHLAAWAV